MYAQLERGSFMRSRGLRVAAGILAVCFGALPPGLAQEKAKVKGVITTHTGENIVVKTTEKSTVTVLVDEDTKVQQPKGLGLRKENVPATLLIPGLKVSVDGIRQDATHVRAKSITFHKVDLQTAELIQAGLTPTDQKVATNQQNIEANTQSIKASEQEIAASQRDIASNQQNITANKTAIDANAVATGKRFGDLTDYDVKGQVDVRFATGSARISAQDQEALKKLAEDAISLKGYIIQVKGFTDSRGSVGMNQKLSMERAQNVIAYLIQNCNVPVYDVIAPGAMGETAPVAPNDTKSGRAENRRVEVRVLVNKGIAGT
jgi:outer membrane protein OmpA-like peptidoglycan-associated protein